MHANFHWPNLVEFEIYASGVIYEALDGTSNGLVSSRYRTYTVKNNLFKIIPKMVIKANDRLIVRGQGYRPLPTELLLSSVLSVGISHSFKQVTTKLSVRRHLETCLTIIKLIILTDHRRLP